MAAILGVDTIQHTNGTTAVTVGTNGSVTAAGTLGVTGASTLTGNTTVGGTLGVTGASTLTNTTVGGALNVSGTTTTNALSDGTATKSKIAFHLWKLNSNLSVSSGAVYITAAMTQVQAVGTPLSVSGGIFTFPYTGIWPIEYQLTGNASGASMYRGGAISSTTDNSNYSEMRNGFTSNGGNTYWVCDINWVFDCTNVTTHKIRFRTEHQASGTVNHNSNFVFTYLGDT